MRFTKMHGCGNDYIFVSLFHENIENLPELAKRLSHRNYGIGSDGLITIEPSVRADFAMDIYNADGSRAEMCGNGIRCVAKYVYDHGMTDSREITVETRAGVKKLTLETQPETAGPPGQTLSVTVKAEAEKRSRGKVSKVRVDMGKPELSPSLIPVNLPGARAIDVPIHLGGQTLEMTCISMGNPHAVIFVHSLKDISLEELGPQVERHPLFPNRTNVEFVEILNRGELRMRVWERGSKETLACGTGACASAMAAILKGYAEDKILVHLLGGDLWIEYHRESGHLFLTGPAVTVFEGEVEENSWRSIPQGD